VTEPNLLDMTGRRLREDAVTEIGRRIVSVANPKRVILFGSAALGEMTADSDVDLLILEDEVPDARVEARKIRAALADLPPPFDVVVMSCRRFEETRGVIFPRKSGHPDKEQECSRRGRVHGQISTEAQCGVQA